MELYSFIEPVLRGFNHLQAAALQNIVEAQTGDLCPFDGGGLVLGNNVPGFGVDFLDSIVAANQDVLECSNTLCIGSSIDVNTLAIQSSTIQMEFYALNQSVLRGLRYLQISTLQLILKAELHYFVPLNRSFLLSRNDVTICRFNLFDCIVAADQDVRKLGHSRRIRSRIEIDLIAVCCSTEKMKLYAFYKAVLRSLRNLQISALQSVVKRKVGHLIPLDRSRLRIRNDIFVGCINLFDRIPGPDRNAFKGCNTDSVCSGVFIDLGTARRCSKEMKTQSFYQAVFCGLRNLKASTLQAVIEGHSCCLATLHSNRLGILGLICIAHDLGNGIRSRLKILNGNLAILI